MTTQEFVEEIKKLKATELCELVHALEEEFGVSAAAAVVAGPAVAGEAAAAEEKSEFNVVLKDVGGNKIAVIKVIREITGLGLVDAKNLVETAGAVVKENVPAEQAKEIEAKLKEAGATVELK